ncbi:MAG: acetylglutamate kinase [Buchnera aphidicola (Eriosoma harunire)]
MINPLVIKLGGVLLDSNFAMERLFTFLSNYRQLYNRKILIVHGGGNYVDAMMSKEGFKIKKIDGLRQTPHDQIHLITGILAGTVNKIILSWTKKKNINAIGLCLSDGDTVIVTPINSKLGCVGSAKPNSPIFLNMILNHNFIPVISSIGIASDGLLMNINADVAAAAIAKTLHANLILLSDVSSILDGKGQRISSINKLEADDLISRGIITDGMIVKVYAALDAAQMLGHSVDIASWQDSSQLELLFQGISIGTRIIV